MPLPLHRSLHRFVRSLCMVLSASLLATCTSMPISTMFSLSRIDPMKIDPGQIRVAVRVDESVSAEKANAKIIMGFKAEQMGIDEEQSFDVQMNTAQTLTPKLTRDMLDGERVTVMSLSTEDAGDMTDFQQRLYQYKADGIDGEGSFSLQLTDLCLEAALPDRDIPLTLFLQTDSQEDYIVFVRYELHDLFTDTDSDIDALTLCEGIETEDV